MKHPGAQTYTQLRTMSHWEAFKGNNVIEILTSFPALPQKSKKIASWISYLVLLTVQEEDHDELAYTATVTGTVSQTKRMIK